MKSGVFQISVLNGNLLYNRELPFRRFPAEGRAQKPALPPQENETKKIFRHKNIRLEILCNENKKNDRIRVAEKEENK